MKNDEEGMGLRANLYLMAAVVIFLARYQNNTKVVGMAKRDHKLTFAPCP